VRSADESVKLFWDPPPVITCDASERVHSLLHAIRRIPILSQPSGLWIQVRYGHLDLKDYSGNAVTWEPTVRGEEVHADRPPYGNVAATSLHERQEPWLEDPKERRSVRE